MTSEQGGAAPMQAFLDAAGPSQWDSRVADLTEAVARGQYSGRALGLRHAVELTLDKLRRGLGRPANAAEQRLLDLAGETARLFHAASPKARDRLRVALQAALSGDSTLVPLFHLMRTARLNHARGYLVQHAWLEDAAPFDLLIARDGVEAEVACDTVSAEDGRDVHRGAWVRLMDRVDPDLQTWLAQHPGRYLLKLTLPRGLRSDGADHSPLAALHGRIRTMLAAQRRADHDEAAVLRLDPLILAGAQAEDSGLMSSLRREFGHEAHLAVTATVGGVFAMAARAGRENDVATAIRRRMAAIAPARLTGTRPGILAMFIEDTDRAEWRHLRERLELEGEARRFLTDPAARCVVAVTCASRLELFGAKAPDGAEGGELRFRNPSHPAARTAALAPAVLSTM